MDALAILKQIERSKNRVEKLNESNNSSGMGSSTGLIISIFIGAFAAYLSYECNSKKDMSEIQKILWAVLAYIFGLLYLIYYALFRYDSCHQY
jgi:O-antigen/teichoic acid export membrane protein